MEAKKEGANSYAGILIFMCAVFFCLLAGALQQDNGKQSSMTVEQKQANLENRKVPAYYQWDSEWASDSYANGTMANSGCGPTCLSMVTVYFTGDEEKTPDWMAEYSTKNGYILGGKTAWTLMGEGAENLGLQVKQLVTDEKKIKRELKKGRLLICSMGPGDFTRSGHFIVLTGYQKGGYTVQDPNSEENSKKIWTYEQISDQIKNIWVYWM